MDENLDNMILLISNGYKKNISNVYRESFQKGNVEFPLENRDEENQNNQHQHNQNHNLQVQVQLQLQIQPQYQIAPPPPIKNLIQEIYRFFIFVLFLLISNYIKTKSDIG